MINARPMRCWGATGSPRIAPILGATTIVGELENSSVNLPPYPVQPSNSGMEQGLLAEHQARTDDAGGLDKFDESRHRDGHERLKVVLFLVALVAVLTKWLGYW